MTRRTIPQSLAETWAKFELSLAEDILTDAYTDDEVAELIREDGRDPDQTGRRFAQWVRERVCQGSFTAASISSSSQVAATETKDEHAEVPAATGQGRQAPPAPALADRGEQEQSIRQILEKVGAIERGAYDYALPQQWHTDTYINVGKICRSEEALASVVAALDKMLPIDPLSLIVSTTWALGTIARRLAWKRRTERGQQLQQVRVEGYDPPAVLDDVPVGADATLLVDVVVTGGQVSRLRDELVRKGARSVRAFAIAQADFSGAPQAALDGALCRIPMKALEASDCARHERMPLMQFNPVAGNMTRKSERPRGPSEFLSKDPAARGFWDAVNGAATKTVFQVHRIIGKRHYIPFIDTLLLLKDPHTGPRIVKELTEKVCRRSSPPDVVLVPPTAKGKAAFLGKLLCESFGKCSGLRVDLVVAQRSRGRLTVQDATAFSGRRVLVADVAAAHGDTVDELALISSHAGAQSVGAAVVLSRMSEGCEIAFDRRLSAGFVRGYSLPIRPFTVYDKGRPNCFVCLRRQDVRQAAADLPAGPVRDLAAALARVPCFKARGTSVSQQSLPLGPLSSYPPRILGGIALHALCAAAEDGMAPLSLRELTSNEYSSKARAALVRYLPPRTLEWSGQQLRDQLVDALKFPDKAVWREVVWYMGRNEKSAEWVDSLVDAFEKTDGSDKWMDEKSWDLMRLVVDRLVREDGETLHRIRSSLEPHLERYRQRPAGRRLQDMIDTAIKASGASESEVGKSA